jgi:hypothetical protein
MKVLKHDDQPLEAWRAGVMTRMRVSALAGGHQLCIFDQFCDPGHGAPMQRLHVRATLAAPIFEASYCGRDEVSRRWVPEDFEIDDCGPSVL